MVLVPQLVVYEVLHAHGKTAAGVNWSVSTNSIQLTLPAF